MTARRNGAAAPLPSDRRVGDAILCAVKWVAETKAFDEAFHREGGPRPHYRPLVSILESFTQTEIQRRERLQKLSLMDQGITFTVYGEKEGIERIFPFDFVPRIIPAREWERLQAGLLQRVTALNLFILDVYQGQKCLKDGVVPAELVLSRKEYKRELLGVIPPQRIYTHVVGTDVIRDSGGDYVVLEDNCRCPSGVSYVLENRNVLSRVFPEFFTAYPVRPIKDYPNHFLDPLTFRRDSLLGVPGLMNVYREGNVALANAPGAGIADDKAVFAFLPELIKYYLGETALLPQVPTYLGIRPKDFTYICEHARELVIKTTGDSGGYGMLMGPFAAKRETEDYVAEMRKNPGNYIAQPLIELSAHPTYVEGRFEPRRIDLRPFILYGDPIRVLPGGLTRVALRSGSYVVNSSQGGGSKDTWVLAPKEA